MFRPIERALKYNTVISYSVQNVGGRGEAWGAVRLPRQPPITRVPLLSRTRVGLGP